MKKFAFALIAVAGFHSAVSLAVIRPGWERPILSAEMVEFDSLGHEINIGLAKTLIMNKQDGAQSATSFTFKEEKKVYCVVAPCPPIKSTAVFKHVTKKVTDCGSTEYTANDQKGLYLEFPTTILTLVDHSTRTCTDYKKYTWEASLSTSSPNARYKQRKLAGNPKPEFTIQRF